MKKLKCFLGFHKWIECGCGVTKKIRVFVSYTCKRCGITKNEWIKKGE